ncbi:MAG: HAD hydrolase-like protein [Akkermansia sp.]|nr:HAD hydrolase-like protein [Akkermansia sp.]
MYKALVFDMDGTLGDTLPLCVEAYRRCVVEQTGHTPTDDEIVQYFGKSDRGVLGALLGIHPDAPELPIARFAEIYEELHATWAPAPFPGAVEMLQRLRERGLRLALITGKEHYTATPTLHRFGMDTFFEWIGYGTPTHNCKDERLLELMQAWQLQAQDILYVGDAPSDIELCHKVGVSIINAAWATTATADAERCQALAPTYRLTQFCELEPLINQLTT